MFIFTAVTRACIFVVIIHLIYNIWDYTPTDRPMARYRNPMPWHRNPMPWHRKPSVKKAKHRKPSVKKVRYRRQIKTM
jgi:hypothetical protein